MYNIKIEFYGDFMPKNNNFDSLIKKAESGDAEAQYNLAEMYENGKGTSQDYEKAMYWYLKAAQNGEPQSMAKIGDMYFNGEGVERNLESAVEWYEKSVKIDDFWAYGSFVIAKADLYYEKKDYKNAIKWYKKLSDYSYNQCRLGDCYFYGQGVKKDYKKAFEWYEKAADEHAIFANDEYAQYKLGYLYYNGLGVEQNDDKAVYWYEKSAEKGYTLAFDQLGWIYDTRINDKQKAKEYFQKAAMQNDDWAQYRLGLLYQNGVFKEADDKIAVKWFKKAASHGTPSQGNISALQSLAICYKNGRGVKQNMQTAISYYEKAGEQNNKLALRNLGEIYLNSDLYYFDFLNPNHGPYARAGELDFKKSKAYLEKAAALGDVKSKYILSWMYFDGYGTKKDLNKSVELLKQAANECNYGGIKSRLAYMYKNGLGVQKDYKKALELYEKAKTDSPTDLEDFANIPQNMWEFLELGDMYLNGNGVTCNYEIGSFYIKKAASFKQKDWKNKYDALRSFDYPVKWSKDSPIDKYYRDIENGYARAQYLLGYLYEKGLGLEQDFVKPINYYKKAANKGYKEAIEALKKMGI